MVHMSSTTTRSRLSSFLGRLAIPAFALVPVAQAAASPSLTVSGVTAVEGSTGTTDFAFAVTLSEASTTTVKVQYATDPRTTDTAALGEDYGAVSGELVFEPGETQKTFIVPVVGDTKYEAGERCTVLISRPVGATRSNAAVKGAITNDDAKPTLTVAGTSGAEGNTGTTDFGFTVTLSQASGLPVTVKYGTTPQS